ncbi:MAG: hypothetical protein QOE19_93 [Actinomycetota bacterium]|jgi:hypothetical protein|nr:hypothetical protein [Actinomycetota bacterium]MDQ1667299.1 hypothetical protein [Actinomycetota bacterium]MDQ1670729.1 hypothetical protein [Actinomycetota bacterium]
MFRVLVFAIPIILAVYALVDCVQTDDRAVRGLPKLVWVAVIALVWVVGPIAWLVVGRDRGKARPQASWRAGPAGGGQGPRPSGRVVAPDDDPEFLRQLGRDQDRRLRDEQSRRDRAAEPGTPDAPDDTDPGSGGDSPRR